MLRTALLVTLLAITFASPVRASLRIYPPEISLSGRETTQQLLVVQVNGEEAVADQTTLASFVSSAPKIIAVDAAGQLTALSDGQAMITTKVGSETTTIKVVAKNTAQLADKTFRNHVIPVLTRSACNTGACHGALAGKGGFKLSLRGYDLDTDHFVLTRQALGRRIDREEPAKSLLLLKGTRTIKHGGGQKLDPQSADYQVLANWIAAGAPGVSDKDAKITRLEVFPPVSVLKPESQMQLSVRAWYSDGHSEDVTRWAKFTSSEDLVANVDADGRIRVIGHGEAGISVWFSDLVTLANVVSPFPNKVEPKVFAEAAKYNSIDDAVLRKLQRLNLPPSPICDDSEFIRRAYLDAAGILPTPEEVKKFLADKSSDKRAKLIDKLLERPEFVDYWAYKWSDLLLVTTRRLPQQGVWSFYSHIRQSVADNKPWDRFARDILTASGNSLRNGAANYFVIHKDVTDLSESTAVTFLGMSLTCARCHNHPLERWTQDQYWQMANLFSRVGLKSGDRGGSVHVQSEPTGEAMHPRRGIAMNPTPLDGKPLSLESAVDRRKYFADWLTAPENPWFAKALVNRVWRNFLGRGLVEAEDDLRETNPPTNTELFDQLAKDFVKNKYDVKKLIRTIMTSATYQRSSKPVPGNEGDDRFYSRYIVRRLTGEVILDAYSQVTNVPTPFTHLNTNARDAITPYNGFPVGTRAMQLPDSLVVSPFLDAFGRPERSQTCSCERSGDATVGQALHLNNGKTLNDKLRAKNSRLSEWLTEKRSDKEVISQLYLLSLCREPTEKELGLFTKMLKDAVADGASRREALEDLCWAVLASKDFVFNR
jgi:hypothetical protein